MKIAFQGQRGSYAEAAAAWMFADEDVATVSCPTAKDVFDALADDDCQTGVVRVENSESGNSYEILDLLRSSEVFFRREVRFHEQYNLAGQAGVEVGDVKRIYAHPAILTRCSGHLRGLSGVEIIARYDSAESLATMVQRGDKTEATVIGDFAASIFGLNVIAPGVENSVTGVTRFVALSTEQSLPSEDAESVHTTAMFELEHKPGALMAALAAFHDRKINITNIFARPNRSGNWDYTVFVEFAGHFDDRNVEAALEDLRGHTTYLQLLGTYDTVEPPGQKS